MLKAGNRWSYGVHRKKRVVNAVLMSKGTVKKPLKLLLHDLGVRSLLWIRERTSKVKRKGAHWTWPGLSVREARRARTAAVAGENLAII